jgi:hypothetical protein
MNAEYWAQIDEHNVVVHVAVVTKEFMDENPEQFPGRWVQTYFDTPGKTYAGSGYTYSEELDDFTAPEPNEHWKRLVGWTAD